MNKKFKISYVICVLVYRNVEDIIEFIQSAYKHIRSCKIIMVNSYYDENTYREFKTIAEKYGCDFLNVPNKGYGYGNNRGIDFAKENYDFEYLIISNPDIVIERFDDSNFRNIKNACIGPIIKTKTGKNQNPYWLVKNIFCERMIFTGLKDNRLYLAYIAFALNRLIREIGLAFFKIHPTANMRVYALHGSFMIVPKAIIDELGCLFDENIFLFGEEGLLAFNLERFHFKNMLTKDVEVFHQEDGSMNLSDIDVFRETKKSFIYYFNLVRNQ